MLCEDISQFTNKMSNIQKWLMFFTTVDILRGNTSEHNVPNCILLTVNCNDAKK